MEGEVNDSSKERSSSTWAEVVSSGREENRGRVAEGDSNYCQNRWDLTKERSELREDGGWEAAGKKKPHQQSSKRPHKVVMEAWGAYKQPPNEQEYIDETSDNIGLQPSREELDDLSQACNRLWELDLDRLVPGKDYMIDCGRGKKAYQKEDVASDRCKEVVTSEEKHEQTAFIEEISRTAPIKYLYHYLVAKDMISYDYENFKRMMLDLWFNLYDRGGSSSCSSAFEHVFVGEIKGRGDYEVSGFHNWIQFYLQEWKGKVDYQGYIFPRKYGKSPDSETHLLTIQFKWNGILKSVSTSLVGVSPEFEIALYTLFFRWRSR
ncbi:poly(U)-specific endoribonuclease-B-like [Zingiber officinale]|uniref:poly(U)-specific endoribonuclease-B-like n=1 Tax=Zingiber officinale TaxID=94328 RepID=UPI001C4CF64D|nr:poly(U)-specific endoribonuclease-B-like [Zingiber officinale]